MTKTKDDERFLQFSVPEWAPLLNLVGELLVEEFMWMEEAESPQRIRVHGYKNIVTRRYLHLDMDGNAYRFQGFDSHVEYLPISAATAIEWAFAMYSDLGGARPECVEAWHDLIQRLWVDESRDGQKVQ